MCGFQTCGALGPVFGAAGVQHPGPGPFCSRRFASTSSAVPTATAHPEWPVEGEWNPPCTAVCPSAIRSLTHGTPPPGASPPVGRRSHFQLLSETTKSEAVGGDRCGLSTPAHAGQRGGLQVLWLERLGFGPLQAAPWS